MGKVTELDIVPQPHLSSELKESGKQMSKKTKLLNAGVIFYGTFMLGTAYNTYGPTITSLQNKYETDDATISRVFTILTGCYMIGALSAAFMYDYINRQLAVIILLSTMAAMMILTPHCPTMVTFFISAAVVGLCSGSYDAAQFVWIMEIFQKDCPPYVQTQHFSYALGTNLASLIMAPFLDEEDEDVPVTSTTSGAFNQNEFSLLNDSSDVIIMAGKNGRDSKLFIPFTIVGLLVAAAAALQVLLFIFLRYFPPPQENQEVDAENKDSVEKPHLYDDKPIIGSWSWPKLRMVILMCCFYGAYQGMEMCTFQFFPKFGQNSELGLSESDSAYVLTGMTAAFAVGRGVAIVVVFKIATQLIVGVNLGLVFIANILLIGWASSNLTVLWASSVLFGLGFSSIYASFSAYMERYVTFTNFMGALMIVCGSGVAAIYPLVVGSFIEKNPVVLSYTAFFSLALGSTAFGCVLYLTHKNKRRY